MIALRKLAAALRANRDGAGAVEFALVAPLMLMFIIGGMYLSMLGFTAASLHYAVEAGARCRSVNTTICTNAATTQTYAAAQFVKIAGDTATFTATTPACGNQVAGTVTFVLRAGVSRYNIPLSATACFPS